MQLCFFAASRTAPEAVPAWCSKTPSGQRWKPRPIHTAASRPRCLPEKEAVAETNRQPSPARGVLQSLWILRRMFHQGLAVTFPLGPLFHAEKCLHGILQHPRLASRITWRHGNLRTATTWAKRQGPGASSTCRQDVPYSRRVGSRLQQSFESVVMLR